MYVNVPSKFIAALGMSWEEFWRTEIFEFKIQDGKAVIELRKEWKHPPSTSVP